MKTNRKPASYRARDEKVALVDKNVVTHGGAPAYTIVDQEALERAVCSCLLWEDEFYESGQSIASRIKALIPKVRPQFVSDLAIRMRGEPWNLRHVPLLLAREMARINTHKKYVGKLLPVIIRRPDEMTEFLSIYWKGEDYGSPLANQVKKGLAEAFRNFSEYQLAKWDRESAIKLKDVMFLVHPDPKVGGSYLWSKPVAKSDGYKRSPTRRHLTGQGLAWQRLVHGNLPTPETWEVLFSSTTDQRSRKQKWEYLLDENKLGYDALLKNLRNMIDDGVDRYKIATKIATHNGASKMLPYQFIAAAKAAPAFSDYLSAAMVKVLESDCYLPGHTVIVVDVSDSMQAKLSERGKQTRVTAAATLAMIAKSRSEFATIVATAGFDGSGVAKHAIMNANSGFALVKDIEAQMYKLGGGGIFIKQLMDYLKLNFASADRIIVITDEQDTSSRDSESPKNVIPYAKRSYMINVGSYDRGIGYGNWTHINGFSAGVVEYIAAVERNK